jgi:hypothetical protein
MDEISSEREIPCFIKNDKLRPSLTARDKGDLELKFVITSRPLVLGT